MKAIERQRKAFETWMRDCGNEYQFDRLGDEPVSYNNSNPGDYAVWFVQLAWDAWQAATECAKKTMCNRN